MMISEEQIFDSTIRIVAGEIIGIYENGNTEIDIEPLLEKAYYSIKKFAKKVNSENSESNGAKIKPVSRRN